jgi:signal transduction histidine kinase/CheY-like chemotaxis protein
MSNSQQNNLATEPTKAGLNRLKIYAYASLLNYVFSGVYSLLSNQTLTFWFMVAATLSVIAALIIGAKFSVVAGQLILVFALNANIFSFCYNAGLMGSSYIFFYPVLVASVFLVGFDKLNWHIFFVIGCTTLFLALTMYLSGEMPKFNLTIETIRGNRTANAWIVYVLMVAFVIVFIRLKIKNDQKLYAAIQKAEEASQAKTQFLSVMSHELRTPLNGIIGISHLLQTAETPEKKTEYMQLLNKSADHMLKMVGDILDYNKMDSNRLELQEHVFQLNNFVTETFQQFKDQFAQKGLSFEQEVIGNVAITVKGDDTRLSQVLYNLLSNALKFTKEGGAKFSVKVIPAGEKQLQITFSVSDTGIGIDQEDKELIFDDFKQGGRTMKQKLGGTGLGLAISKQLLQLMSSNLYMESTPAKGSKFWFTVQLPIATEEDVAANSKVDIELQPFIQKNIKVLVAEDNHVNSVVAGNLLKKWNAECVIVKNGQEALDELEKNQYDLILMDLEMPVMDGFSATAIIRSKNNNVPVIALTATLMEKATIKKLVDFGFNDAVSKPFKPAVLYSSIKRFTAS